MIFVVVRWSCFGAKLLKMSTPITISMLFVVVSNCNGDDLDYCLRVKYGKVDYIGCGVVKDHTGNTV